jgi:hypothetical protein
MRMASNAYTEPSAEEAEDAAPAPPRRVHSAPEKFLAGVRIPPAPKGECDQVGVVVRTSLDRR